MFFELMHQHLRSILLGAYEMCVFVCLSVCLCVALCGWLLVRWNYVGNMTRTLRRFSPCYTLCMTPASASGSLCSVKRSPTYHVRLFSVIFLLYYIHLNISLVISTVFCKYVVVLRQ